MTFSFGNSGLGDGNLLGDGQTVTAEPISVGPSTPYCTPQDVARQPEGECDDATLVASCIADATNVLYRMTGRQFSGPQQSVLRPCCCSQLQASDSWAGGASWTAGVTAGRWYNVPSRFGCAAFLSWECGALVARLDLATWPVLSAEVTIDGVALPASAFRIDANRYLVREDGGQWPFVNDLALPLGSVGTWSVSVVHGLPYPSDLVTAAAELANDLVKYRTGDDDCALSRRATSMNKQGVAYSLTNVSDLVAGGNTGLLFVDMVIKTLNPRAHDDAPRVLSPDIASPIRTNG